MSDLETFNPKRQECLGKYLFGSGYYASEDQQAGILRGERTDASFCSECPVKKECERLHGLRVRSTVPEQVDAFERQVSEAQKRGMSRTLASMARMKSGDPDPYMKMALENYHEGVRARKRERET